MGAHNGGGVSRRRRYTIAEERCRPSGPICPLPPPLSFLPRPRACVRKRRARSTRGGGGAGEWADALKADHISQTLFTRAGPPRPVFARGTLISATSVFLYVRDEKRDAHISRGVDAGCVVRRRAAYEWWHKCLSNAHAGFDVNWQHSAHSGPTLWGG